MTGALRPERIIATRLLCRNRLVIAEPHWPEDVQRIAIALKPLTPEVLGLLSFLPYYDEAS